MEEFNAKVFWERVEALTEKRGMTVKALSEKIGVPVNSVRVGKNRGYKPNIETVVNIASELGTTVEWLVTGKAPDGIIAKSVIKAVREKLDELESLV